MTASTDPQQSDTEPDQSDLEPDQAAADPDDADDAADPARRRRRPPVWLLVAAGLLVVVAVVTFTRDNDTAVPADLSTPEGAAQAFARASAVGDVDGVIAVTCLGDEGCAAEHGDGVTPEQIDAAKKVIADNVHEIGNLFGRVEFTAARAGTEPGTQEVDYRLPGMRERNYLIFVEHEDRWLYIGTGTGAGSAR